MSIVNRLHRHRDVGYKYKQEEGGEARRSHVWPSLAWGGGRFNGDGGYGSRGCRGVPLSAQDDVMSDPINLY